MSPNTGLNPFGKTTGVSQTLHNTKSWNAYYGNINKDAINKCTNATLHETNLNSNNRFQNYKET